MASKGKKIAAFVIVGVIALGSLYAIRQKYPEPKVPSDNYHYNPKPIPSSPLPTTPAPTSPNASLPAIKLLAVPFTPQAPTGNWDTLHNEDCEEASAIMANAYFNGPQDAKLSATLVEEQLTKLTDWEQATFGYNLDITSEETVKMIEANFNLRAKMVTSYTQQDIKNELNQNHLVLIPVNGQMIGNPNYKAPGPKYHVLVIRGYTPASIITNDPGTRNGQNYSYSYQTLYDANGNWSHQDQKVDLNQKNIIVVWKE